jgi:hypothetical protein
MITLIGIIIVTPLTIPGIMSYWIEVVKESHE